MSAAQTTARARAQTKKQSKGGCAVARSFSAADLLDSARSCWAGRSGGACACRCSAALDAASSFSVGSAAEYCSLRGISRRATPSTVHGHKIHDGAARIAAVCVPQRPLAEEWQGRRAAYCRATFARAQVVLANELCGTVAGARSVVGRVSIRGWSSNTVRAQPALPRAAAGARTAECGPVSCGPIEYSHPKEARTLV